MAGKPNDKPPANEVATQRQWLRNHGVPANVAVQLINPANTRRQNANNCANWMKDRPKAK